MQLLDGKSVSTLFKAQLKKDVKAFIEKHKRAPKLSVILVGDDPASQIYTEKKGKAALAAGMQHETIRFPKNTDPKVLKEKCDELNNDKAVDGILIQRPLPKQFKESDVIFWVHPDKDVDAFHPLLIGQLQRGLDTLTPCTPTGIKALLKHYQIPLESQTVCVVGRSSLVGDPMTTMLKQLNATTIQCHSKTKNLSQYTKLADVLVVAAGKRKLISKEHIKKGAVVVDVGMHRLDDGTLCGDVDFESVKDLVSAITPVPGGVGPLTITFLLLNTLKAAKHRMEKPS